MQKVLHQTISHNFSLVGYVSDCIVKFFVICEVLKAQGMLIVSFEQKESPLTFVASNEGCFNEESVQLV